MSESKRSWESRDSSRAVISQAVPGALGSDLRGAGFGLLKLDLDFGDSGKSPGCLCWGILGAVKQACQFWSKAALKALSEELNELRKSD